MSSKRGALSPYGTQIISRTTSTTFVSWSSIHLVMQRIVVKFSLHRAAMTAVSCTHCFYSRPSGSTVALASWPLHAFPVPLSPSCKYASQLCEEGFTKMHINLTGLLWHRISIMYRWKLLYILSNVVGSKYGGMMTMGN